MFALKLSSILFIIYKQHLLLYHSQLITLHVGRKQVQYKGIQRSEVRFAYCSLL